MGNTLLVIDGELPLQIGDVVALHGGVCRIVVADLEEFEKNGPEPIRAAAACLLMRHEPMNEVEREAADRPCG